MSSMCCDLQFDEGLTTGAAVLFAKEINSQHLDRFRAVACVTTVSPNWQGIVG